MKIAVIGAKGIPAKHGGIERYCQELYPRITQRGHKVDLYVQPKYHHQSWFSIHYYHQVRLIALSSIPGRQLNHLFTTALNTIWASFGNYDVIHIHGIAAAWFAWFPQLFSNSSVIVTCHQLDCQPVKWHKIFHWLLSRIEKTAVQSSDDIIVTSEALADYFLAKYGIFPQCIVNAPASYVSSEKILDRKKAFGLDRTKYILYLGTFEPEQRLDLLIKAFQELQTDNWQLILAGGMGQYLEYANTLLETVDRDDNIIFTGEIRGRFLTELVGGADIFIDPSEGNSLGSSMTMLEAMREGIPIVASDTIIHRKILNSDRGLLFKSGQLDSLVAQLKYAMAKPNLMLAMAKKAQTYIAVNHNWDRVTYKNLYLYLQLTTKVPINAPKQPTVDH